MAEWHGVVMTIIVNNDSSDFAVRAVCNDATTLDEAVARLVDTRRWKVESLEGEVWRLRSTTSNTHVIVATLARFYNEAIAECEPPPFDVEAGLKRLKRWMEEDGEL